MRETDLGMVCPCLGIRGSTCPTNLRFILIHRVPESSLPPWHTLPQVISGGWEQRRYRDWWPVFQRYQLNPVPKERDTYGRFLYNGAPYSKAYSRPSHSAGGQAGRSSPATGGKDNQSQQEDNLSMSHGSHGGMGNGGWRRVST